MNETHSKPSCGRGLMVAQVSNLLYRRPSSLRGLRIFARVRVVGSPADWTSAISPESFRGTQVEHLRYFRSGFAALGYLRIRPGVHFCKVIRSDFGHRIASRLAVAP